MTKRKTITIPESANEIPLRRYQKFMKFMALEEEERTNIYKVISILADISIKEAKLIKARDVGRVLSALIKALSDTDVQLVKKIEIDGIWYGFEPNLNDINIGMLADLTEHFDNVDSWHKALANLYRPIVRESGRMGGIYAIEPHVYPSKEYDKRVELMQDVPASVFISVRAFFLNGSRVLSSIIEGYSTRSRRSKL